MDYNYGFNDIWVSKIESLFDYYDYIITFCDYINNEDMKKGAAIAIYKNREKISNRIVNHIQYIREYNSVGYFPEDYADWSNIALKFNPNNTEAIALKEFYERQI